MPNQGLELTASSVRSYVAPASGSSSGLAFGCTRSEGVIHPWVSPEHSYPFAPRRCGMEHHSQPLLPSLTRRRVLQGTLHGSVAKFDFWAKSKNRVSGIQ